jgi:hypothetical protein
LNGQGRAQTLLGTAAVGLVGGAAVALAAFLLARYGPAGAGWSFRGNGAIAAYTLVPVVLTAGWTSIVLRARAHPSWMSLGLGAGLVALVIALAGAAMVPLFGAATAASVGTAVLLVALLLWMIVAPALAARAEAPTPAALGTNLVAGIVLLVGVLAGLFTVGLVIPAGS